VLIAARSCRKTGGRRRGRNNKIAWTVSFKGLNFHVVCVKGIQNVRFMVSPDIAGLSHKKPASAETSCGSCGAQGHHKRDTIYLSINKRKLIHDLQQSGNACCHSVQNVLSFSLLSRNIQIKIYRTVILPVVLCMGVKLGCSQ